MRPEIDVLFVDDEDHLRNSVAQKYKLSGLRARKFANAHSALEQISSHMFSVVVSDIRMPGMDGLQLLEAVLGIDSDIPVILLTGHGDIKLAVKAMRSGAYDFLEKPFDPDHLVEVTRNAISKRNIVLENRALRSKIANAGDLQSTISGTSAFANKLRADIQELANLNANVLITGATGTGKSAVARAIHQSSVRALKPFTVVDCGAISDDQLEVTLFGHEQGAFVGAMRSRFGKLEAAQNGTVLFDRMDSASANLQAKLLALLENRTIQRLGSNETIELDIRILASTNANLEELVSTGQFRADLFHRLNTIELNLLGLAQRIDDLPELFERQVADACIRHDRPPTPIGEAHISRMLLHDWPGNIRELKQEAEKYVLGYSRFSSDDGPISSEFSLAERMMLLEKQVIASELLTHGGVLKSVQASLGVSRKSLYEKMRKYNLDKMDFR